MQYIRRRIQRVSGVTIRDERVESRDFSVLSRREELSRREDWDNLSAAQRKQGAAKRDVPPFERQGINYRERT